MRLFLGRILAAFGEYVKAPKSAFWPMFSDSKVLRLFAGRTLSLEPPKHSRAPSHGLVGVFIESSSHGKTVPACPGKASVRARLQGAGCWPERRAFAVGFQHEHEPKSRAETAARGYARPPGLAPGHMQGISNSAHQVAGEPGASEQAAMVRCRQPTRSVEERSR